MTQTKNASDTSVRINSEQNLSDTPDQTLVTRVARGDSAALEALYDRYASRVLGMALKVIGDQALAEDILQETFWRVWQNAAAYQSHLGPFTGWLFRIVRNLSIDAYRRRNVRPQAILSANGSDPILDETPDPDMDVAEQAQAILANRQIRTALASLPDVQRQVIELAYYQGLSQSEIAEVLGWPLGTVKTRLRTAMEHLRQEWGPR